MKSLKLWYNRRRYAANIANAAFHKACGEYSVEKWHLAWAEYHKREIARLEGK